MDGNFVYMNRKRYKLEAKDFLESSIYATAFVSKPAIEVGLIYLNDDKTPSYRVKMEKGIAYSPVLIPNQIIPRKSEDGDEFEVYFEADTIEELSHAYMKAGSPLKNWNAQHNDREKLDGISVVENWIIEDPESDKATRLGFKGLPKGTWMQGIKVENEEVKEKIKSGEYFGISIEGDFEHIKLKKEDQSLLTKLSEEVMNLKDQLTKLASGKKEEKQKFASATLQDGTVVYYEGEELREGSALFIDESLETKAPVGDHVLESGQVVTVDDNGLVTSLRAREEEEMEFSKEDVEKIGKVSVSNAEKLEALEAENAELKTKLAAIESKIEEHSVKLSKVNPEEKVDSTLKLESNKSEVNYISNRTLY